MRVRSAAATVIVMFAVSVGFAQENPPASASAVTPQATTQSAPQATAHPAMRRWGKNVPGNKQAGPVPAPSLQQQVQDLQDTIEKMHAVLQQMHGKMAATTKDPMFKANLQMWELMVGQLDKQLQELKQTQASREDMEARRAAMYKQAEIKSQAAARAAQQAMFSKQPTGTVTTQSGGQGSVSTTPSGSQTPDPNPK